jgi:predicted transcriptional regulator
VLTPRQLRAARALLGVTQAQLAKKAGVSLSALRGFEAERTDTRHSVVMKLERAVEALGVRLQHPDREGGVGVRLKR